MDRKEFKKRIYEEIPTFFGVKFPESGIVQLIFPHIYMATMYHQLNEELIINFRNSYNKYGLTV